MGCCAVGAVRAGGGKGSETEVVVSGEVVVFEVGRSVRNAGDLVEKSF